MASLAAGVAAFSVIHDSYYISFAITFCFGAIVPSTHSTALIAYNSNTMISTDIQYMYKLKSTACSAMAVKQPIYT